MSGTVSVINGGTNTVIMTIKVGKYPDAMVYDLQNELIYVANAASNTVSVINTSSNKVIDTISVGSWPDAITYDPQNGNIYVANFFTGTITIISTKGTSTPLMTFFSIIAVIVEVMKRVRLIL